VVLPRELGPQNMTVWLNILQTLMQELVHALPGDELCAANVYGAPVKVQ
jgi:hypothetical protein